MLFRASRHCYVAYMKKLLEILIVSMLFRASRHCYLRIGYPVVTKDELCQCSSELHVIVTVICVSEEEEEDVSMLFRASRHCYKACGRNHPAVSFCVNALPSFTSLLPKTLRLLIQHLRCVNALPSFTSLLPHPFRNP